MKNFTRERCTAPGCRRAVHARGLCNAHYQRSVRGQPLTELRRRGAPTGTTRVRVVLYLSPEAALFVGRAGRGALERVVEDRAILEARHQAALEARAPAGEDFDLCLNPPSTYTDQEPLP